MTSPWFTRLQSRRQALRLASNGFGWLAASSLLGAPPAREHHPAKAKRVVFLFMPGGVSPKMCRKWKYYW